MPYNNQIKLTFSNLLDSDFTFGKVADGFPPPTLSQDMSIVEALVSPLTSVGTQSLVIGESETFVDWVESQSPLGSLIANPVGAASASVVWTNYALKLRFGLSATIAPSHLDNVPLVVGYQPPPAAITWAYMMDCVPDQPVQWLTAKSPKTGFTQRFPCNPSYQLVVEPIVGDFTIHVAAQIQTV
jgi:hypothetical protein